MKKNSRNKNKRSQVSKTAKSGNTKYMEGMQQLRRSNAAGTHRTAKDYQRKGKYGNDYRNMDY